jgi:hypothetical protein
MVVGRFQAVTAVCKHVFVPTTDQLTHALDGLFTLSNAMHREFLRHIAAFDRAEAWREDGAHDMYDWYCFRYGASIATAREEVDTSSSAGVATARSMTRGSVSSATSTAASV